MAAFTVTLPLDKFEITESKETESGILIFGCTTETEVACHVCGKLTSSFHGYDEERCVEHLPVFGKSVHIFYRPRRHLCIRCNIQGITTTATPIWHYTKSEFTYGYESRLILYLVNSTKSDVAIKNNLTE